MAEVVDSIIAELVVRQQQYVAGFNEATAAHERFTKSIPKIGALGGISDSDAKQYADRHKDAANDTAKSEEAATDRIVTTRKKRTAETKAADDAEKASAKDRASATKAAAKEEATAQKEAQAATAARVKAEQDYQIALARVKEGEIVSARKQREELNRLRSQEAEGTAQARSSSFLAPLGAKGLSGQSARTSADVFKEQFRVEAVESREAAKAEAELAKARDNAGRAADDAAAREARRDASAARRIIRDPKVQPGSGNGLGATVPRETTGQRPIGGALGGDAAEEVAAEREVNRLAAEIATIQAGKTALVGQEKRDTAEILAQLRLEKQLLAANVGEEEILLRLESLRTAQAAKRVLEDKADAAKGGSLKSAGRFVEGAGIGRTGGSGAALAGIVAGTVVAGVAGLAKEGLDYANDLKVVSQQLGLTTRDLQVYQSAAERVGVSTEQLRTAFSDLSNNIGRAKEGADQQSKIFGKDGLNIDLTRKGYETLSGILPTIVDRFTAIKDPAKRAALETALFGESGRKLDSLLSGGNASIKALGDELERTGGILAGEDIARSAKVARDLKLLGDQLERQLASTVSQNAAAIETLATSLLKGAQALLTFVGAFSRFRAQSQIASGDPGLAAAGRDTLNQSPEGRDQALRNNNAILRTLRQGARSSDALLNVGAGQGTGGFGNSFIPNTPEARAALARQIRTQNNTTIGARNAAAALDGSGGAPAQAGSPGNLNVFAPKGPKGKSADQLAKEAEQREKRYQDELAQINAEALAAKREQIVGDDAQLAADRDALKAARDKTATDIAAQVKLKQIDAAHEAELIAANEAAYQEKLRALALKDAIRRQQGAFEIDQDALASELERNQSEQQLATTIDERKRLALQALKIEHDRQANAFNNTINSIDPGVTDESRDRARAGLNDLQATTAKQRQVVEQQNQHPLDAYLTRLHQATDSTKDAVQQVEVNALGKLEDQLSSSLTKVLGLKGAFGDLFGSILSDLAKIEIEKGLLSVLGGGKAGASSGGGIGGFFGSLLSALGGKGGGGDAAASIGAGADDFGFSGVPGFANGGSATIGGNPGIDQNILSINGKPSLRVGSGEQLTITPNNSKVSPAVQGPSQIVQHITVDQRNSVVPAEFAGQILNVADARSRQHAAQAGQAAVNAAPARIKSIQTLGN